MLSFIKTIFFCFLILILSAIGIGILFAMGWADGALFLARDTGFIKDGFDGNPRDVYIGVGAAIAIYLVVIYMITVKWHESAMSSLPVWFLLFNIAAATSFPFWYKDQAYPKEKFPLTSESQPYNETQETTK